MGMSDADKVLLPIIRRVMPNLIAQSIVGVQPMTGATGRIFDTVMGRRDDSMLIRFFREDYHRFLRLYDRRHYHSHNDVVSAGYGVVVLDDLGTAMAARQDCWERYGRGCKAWGANFYFADDEDMVEFSMRWA
jgi:hypothetical protein